MSETMRSGSDVEAELAEGFKRGSVVTTVFSKTGRILSAPGMSVEEVRLRAEADFDPERMREICAQKVSWGDMTREQADEHFAKFAERARVAGIEVEKFDREREAKGLSTRLDPEDVKAR